MSKLFKLKQWLTLTDTSKYLSTVFEEEVTEADILQLALDDRLVLSFNLVNMAYARKCEVVNEDAIEWAPMPDWLKSHPALSLFNIADPFKISLELGNGQYLNFAEDVIKINGVWDLPMIGGEYLDIQERHLKLLGTGKMHLIAFDGAFLRDLDGNIWCLQTLKTPKARNLGVELRDIADNIFQQQVAETEQLKPVLIEFIREMLLNELHTDKNNGLKFSPLPVLPDDGFLVVRKEMLQHFVTNFEEESNLKKPEPNLSETERRSLLKIIYGMAISKYDYRPGATRNYSTGANRGSIFADLERHGLSLDPDTIRKFIKEAEALFE